MGGGGGSAGGALSDVSNKIKSVGERILAIDMCVYVRARARVCIYICIESFRGLRPARSSAETVFISEN
jgi:hypothetical protein